jgi:hypothetical protein
MELIELNEHMNELLGDQPKARKVLDAYSRSHLMDMHERTTKALEGVYIVE